MVVYYALYINAEKTISHNMPVRSITFGQISVSDKGIESLLQTLIF